MSVCDDYYYARRQGLHILFGERHPLTCRDYSVISDNCCRDHVINSRSESPMPWIGIYVAAASLICSLAMAADVFHGFRHRKLWFPCKFFTLNAASLTLLAVAMKPPVDLSSQMPTPVDQLAKLTSTAFMSTAIGNFMPSLGGMDDKEIFMNITALAILVITIIVNIFIQFSTQVIDYWFLPEHNAVLCFMFVLLLVSSFAALTSSTTKKHLQLKYDDKHKIISCEESKETKKFKIEKLKVNLDKYRMMAKSGSPQFVMARSVHCYASGAICCFAALTLAKVHLRMFFYDDYSYYINPHNVGSSYKWSTFVVVVIQSFGVVVGTIAPAFRCFTAIRLRCSEKRVKSYKAELKIENYWIERLEGWQQSFLGLRFWGQKCRRRVHNTQNLILNFCIRVQIVIVTISKLNLLISVFLVSLFLTFGRHLYKVFKQKLISKHTASGNQTGSESGTGTELEDYVLYLEGEEELRKQIMKDNMDVTNRFIQKGGEKQRQNLKDLLEKSAAFMGVAKTSAAFMGVTRFDSDKFPLDTDMTEPPNCWSLPVVTLTSIAISLPKIQKPEVEWLLGSVNEGLFYANLVEKFLNVESDMVNIRNAADKVWLTVELFQKWLDEDLREIAREGNNSMETLVKLAGIAKNSVDIEFKANANEDLKKNPLNWPTKVIAANSMHRISQTVLQEHQGSIDQTDETLFAQLSVMIADILGACLTNLPPVIAMKCFHSAIEEREKSVQHVAELLGETEEILKILQWHAVPNLNPDKVAYIDGWRALIKQENSLAFTSLMNDGTSSSGSGELQIATK